MGRPGRPRKHDPVADEICRLIRYGDTDEAQSLIAQNDVDVTDGEGFTPLIWAAFNDRRELLEWLIEQGANVDHQERNGYCGLHAASQERHVEVARILLAAGASTEMRDHYGNTPLWTATFNARGDYSVFKLLLEHGASLENENDAGKTVREMATTMFEEDFKAILADLKKE